MEEIKLPPINELYGFVKSNKDYKVIRKYEGSSKIGSVNPKPTKRNHYLDNLTRLNCSPGPANQSNHQTQWKNKSVIQSKRSQKITYLDEIQRDQKKLNFPSPNAYSIKMPWPKQEKKQPHLSERINFLDTSEYQGLNSPGPGTYRVYSSFNTNIEKKKYEPHKPIKQKEQKAADMTTYNPIEYNTFRSYELKKCKTQGRLQKIVTKNKKQKQNLIPGPGSYSTLNYWQGKDKLKQNELNYLNHLSKGPTQRVYY